MLYYAYGKIDDIKINNGNSPFIGTKKFTAIRVIKYNSHI
jgi:hypothetical protein